MGLLDSVGDIGKAASELNSTITTPEMGDALKAALDGQLGHPEGAVGNPLDALSHLSDVQVDLAPILGALDNPAVDAMAQSRFNSTQEAIVDQQQLNSMQEVIEAQLSTMSQLNDVIQGVIENLHSNADGVQDGDAAVVAVTDSGDGHASAHADPDSSSSHVDAPAPHEDVAASDPSATSA